MSKTLLSRLNGENNGKFKEWLDAFEGEPNIAWYPSAGQDFRDLLYLDQQYSGIAPSCRVEPAAPDIFLHTDYFPWSGSSFLDTPTIHLDGRTSVSVKAIEELPRCDLPLAPELVHFPKRSSATGRVLFLEIEIRSNKLGTFTRAVVYVFAENAAFCAHNILPSHGRLSHIVHVRYGGGCGGGGSSDGAWLLNILTKVGCELFISDGQVGANQTKPATRRADQHVYELYPELAGPKDVSQLVPIRTTPSASWSGHGDVTWNLVKQPLDLATKH